MTNLTTCAKCGSQIVKSCARKYCSPCSESVRIERERGRKRILDRGRKRIRTGRYRSKKTLILATTP